MYINEFSHAFFNRFSVKMIWDCLNDPNDHNSVLPCAPDKIPEFSVHKVGDRVSTRYSGQNGNVLEKPEF